MASFLDLGIYRRHQPKGRKGAGFYSVLAQVYGGVWKGGYDKTVPGFE